jgi:hypothetical protein
LNTSSSLVVVGVLVGIQALAVVVEQVVIALTLLLLLPRQAQKHRAAAVLWSLPLLRHLGQPIQLQSVLVVLLGQALIHGDYLVQILFLAQLLLMAVVVEVQQAPALAQEIQAARVVVERKTEMAAPEQQIKVVRGATDRLLQINTWLVEVEVLVLLALLVLLLQLSQVRVEQEFILILLAFLLNEQVVEVVDMAGKHRGLLALGVLVVQEVVAQGRQLTMYPVLLEQP